MQIRKISFLIAEYIYRNLQKLYWYPRWIGISQAAAFVFYELFNRKVLKLIKLGKEEIYVRTATPDLYVAASSLISREYSNIKCHNPSVIVDAGANIGTSAIYFANTYPNARIWAIEPEQENYDILLRNTRKYKNIIPIKAALWSEKCSRTLKDRYTGPWGYTVSETDNKNESTGQQVECLTISSLVDDYDLRCIDILKMDIEGGEKQVLESAEEWIDKVNIITAELHDRICMGCDRAFYLATRHFTTFEKHGEKVTAYR